MFFSVFLFGLLAGLSPGPDFFLVTKNAVSSGKAVGIATAVGVASALVIHATYSIAGLTVIMEHEHLLFVIIQLAGAAYLAYLGIVSIVSSLRRSGSADPEAAAPRVTRAAAFRSGFLCNILNPKAYLFFLSVFSQFMSPSTPVWVEGVYAAEVIVAVGGWFVLLSVLVSGARFRRGLSRIQKWVDRAFGGILLFFAVKIGKAALGGH